MKKKRFGLLTKIILLTGVLTILTVSTSLTVNLLISRNTTRKSYRKSCEDVTDNIELVFYPETQKAEAQSVANMLIESYETVRDKYDQMTDAEINEYQSEVRVTLFDPIEGTLGMDYQKSVRKSYYSEAVSRMQSLCSNYKVPYSSVNIYDVEKQRLITIAENDTTKDAGIDENLSLVGLVDPVEETWALDFYNTSSESYSFQTLIIDEIVMSFNYVNVKLDNSNYKVFVCGQYPLAEVNETFNKQLLTELIISFASATFLVIIYAIFTKLFLIRNVEKLTKSTNQFVDKMQEGEQLEIVDCKVNTTDEIRELSDSFGVMQEQIITYVENIKKAKDIEQAFKAEVEIASKIQLESLPAQTHLDRNLELRAFIKPAKGVGGDFYDYFYIDKDHIAVVIADVSGKGIPASLFMMRSKESIRSASMNEKDLAKVFFKVNNSLCVNNKEGFFVTAFLGVLNLKTFEFNFISAGHERPFIKHKGKCYRMEVNSNFVLGLEEDFPYEQEKIQLEEGDSIFMYTDGLNEAINVQQEEFGYDRIKESLNKDPEPRENIQTVIKDLEQFEGEAEQFDDITIMSFLIKKNITAYDYLNPTYNDIPDLTAKVEECLEGLDPMMLSKIGVVIDEVMNNIISYGKTKTNKTLTVSIEKTDDGATLVFSDNSHPFNPLLKEKHTIPENMEKGIVGGVGISIVTSITKETEYTYSNNRNILIIKF